MEALAPEVKERVGRWQALAGITAAFALALNVALLWRDDRPLGTDEALHYLTSLEQARVLEGPLTSWRPVVPKGALYPPQQYLLGGLAMQILGGRDPEPIVTAVDGLFWVVLLASVWSFARRAANARAAAVAVIFCCTTPLLFEAGRSYFLDFGLTAWIAAVLWALQRSEGGRPGRGLAWVLAAVLLATLQKWSAPLYLAGPALWVLWSMRGWTRRERWQAIGAGAFTLLFALGLWSQLTDTGRFLSFTGELHGRAEDMGLPGIGDRAAWTYYLERFVLGNPIAWAHLIAGLVLAWPLWRERSPSAGWLLAWGVLGWIVLSLFGRKDPRYLLPLLPALGIWIAVGLEALARRRPAAGMIAIGLMFFSSFCQLSGTAGLLPGPLDSAFEARLEDQVPAPRFDHSHEPGVSWALDDVVEAVAGAKPKSPRILLLGRQRVVNPNTLRCELARRAVEADVWLPGLSEETALERAATCHFFLVKGWPREPWRTSRTPEREAGRRAALSAPFLAPERYRTRIHRYLPDGSHLTLLERLEEPRAFDALDEQEGHSAPPGELLASDGERFVMRQGNRLALQHWGSREPAQMWDLGETGIAFHRKVALAPEDDVVFLAEPGESRTRLRIGERSRDALEEVRVPLAARWLLAGDRHALLSSPGGVARIERTAEEGWRLARFPWGGVAGPPAASQDGSALLVARERRLSLLTPSGGRWQERPIGTGDLEGPLLASALSKDGASAAWIAEGEGGAGDWRLEWFDLEQGRTVLRWDVRNAVLRQATRLQILVSREICAVLTTLADGSTEVRVYRTGEPLPVLRSVSSEEIVGAQMDGAEVVVVTRRDGRLRRWR